MGDIPQEVIEKIKRFHIELIQSLDGYDEVVLVLQFMEERARTLRSMYELLSGNPNVKGNA